MARKDDASSGTASAEERGTSSTESSGAAGDASTHAAAVPAAPPVSTDKLPLAGSGGDAPPPPSDKPPPEPTIAPAEPGAGAELGWEAKKQKQADLLATSPYRLVAAPAAGGGDGAEIGRAHV